MKRVLSILQMYLDLLPLLSHGTTIYASYAYIVCRNERKTNILLQVLLSNGIYRFMLDMVNELRRKFDINTKPCSHNIIIRKTKYVQLISV